MPFNYILDPKCIFSHKKNSFTFSICFGIMFRAETFIQSIEFLLLQNYPRMSMVNLLLTIPNVVNICDFSILSYIFRVYNEKKI